MNILLTVKYNGLAEVWLSLQSLPDNVPSDQGFWKCGWETTLLPDPNIRPWVKVLVSRNETRTAEDRECLALFCVCSRHEVRGKSRLTEAFRSHICARAHFHKIIYIRPIQLITYVLHVCLKKYPFFLQNMYQYFPLLWKAVSVVEQHYKSTYYIVM